MALRTRETIVLAKHEATYGTDPSPTGSSNAMRIFDLDLRPLEADTIDRTFFTGYLGLNQQLVVNKRAGVTFSIELAGSGTNDTAPAWGVLMRGCGMEEIVDSNDKVRYQPDDTPDSSVTLHIFIDGIKHVLSGARGTYTMTMSPGSLPMATFTFTGIYNSPSDASNPDIDLSDFRNPVSVENANTTLSFNGSNNYVMHSFDIDIGNNVVWRNLVGVEEAIIADRGITGNATFDLTSVANGDWVDLGAAQHPLSFDYTLGTQAGAKVQVTSSRCILGLVTYGDANGIRTVTAPLRFERQANSSQGSDITVVTK